MRTHDTQTEAKINLARRAVACPGWRWMPGMRYRGESWGAWGWVRVSERPEHIAALNERAGDDEVLLPDLDDPATLGCLLALVREAWGDAHIVCEWHGDHWALMDHEGCLMGSGGRICHEPFAARTEDEALACALEAALEAAP